MQGTGRNLATDLNRLIVEYRYRRISKDDALREAKKVLHAHVLSSARLGVRDTTLRLKKPPDIMPPELPEELDRIVAGKLKQFKIIIEDVK